MKRFIRIISIICVFNLITLNVYATELLDNISEDDLLVEESLIIDETDLYEEDDILTIDDTDSDLLENEFPNLYGMSEEKAILVLHQLGFKDSNIIIKYVNTENDPDGCVISQSIKSGSTIDLLDTITLDIATNDLITNNEQNLLVLDHYELTRNSTEAPSIDNGAWNGYPCSYEYNWDNSQNCWYWGVWGGNGNLQGYKTENGTYDSNVRHKMAMYCDGENVHLYIKYAACYYEPAMGEDFNIAIDGKTCKFRVVYDNGQSLKSKRDEGTYGVTVLHENNVPSSREVLGASGCLVVNKGNISNELEIKIPIEQFLVQNPKVNTEHFSKIDFYNPNLMYRHINCGGASSGSLGFVIISILFIGGFYIYSKKYYKVK